MLDFCRRLWYTIIVPRGERLNYELNVGYVLKAFLTPKALVGAFPKKNWVNNLLT